MPPPGLTWLIRRAGTERARQIGTGLFVRSAGPRARYVYGVRNGRVRFRAVATRAASKDVTVLRRYVALAKL